MVKNKYKRYYISQSLNGDQIVFLARYGKQKELIGRASSESKLVEMMNQEAQRVDDEVVAKQKALQTTALDTEESSRPAKKKKKGLGVLWEPGSMIKKETDVVENETDVEIPTEAVSTETNPVNEKS